MTSGSGLEGLGIRFGSFTWVNIDKPDPDLLNSLKKEYTFHCYACSRSSKGSSGCKG